MELPAVHRTQSNTIDQNFFNNSCPIATINNNTTVSASIFHSMCESFSSKDVAEDCLREQNRGQQHQSNKSELPTAAAAASSSLASEESALGVEVLAQAIDSILMRVQVSFSDTTPWPSDTDGIGATLQRISGTAFANDPITFHILWAQDQLCGVHQLGLHP